MGKKHYVNNRVSVLFCSQFEVRWKRGLKSPNLTPLIFISFNSSQINSSIVLISIAFVNVLQRDVGYMLTRRCVE